MRFDRKSVGGWNRLGWSEGSVSKNVSSRSRSKVACRAGALASTACRPGTVPTATSALAERTEDDADRTPHVAVGQQQPLVRLVSAADVVVDEYGPGCSAAAIAGPRMDKKAWLAKGRRRRLRTRPCWRRLWRGGRP